MDELRLNVRLRGTQKRYFEEQKERLGISKDSKALRAIIDEHKKVIDFKY